MRNIKWLVPLVVVLMLAGLGCERKITGDVEQADINSEGCFVCHAGYLDQAQGEWANSIHASGNQVDYTNRGGTNCTRCHNQQGFIQFLETGTLPDEPFANVSAIGCFTCHNPHETNTMELRTETPYTLENGDVFDHGKGNLCVNCHHARISAGSITDNQVVTSRFGPHYSPQGDMINRSNGYEFPGLSYVFLTSPHANQVRDACAGCHMGNVRTHEGYDVGGHSFNMVSPIDEEVTQAPYCATTNCHPGVTELDFTDEDSRDFDNDGEVEGYQSEFEGLVDSLREVLYAAGMVNSSGTPVADTIADKHAAGALYNFVLAEEDQSKGVHNFKYIRTLLEASIDYINGLATVGPAPKRIAMLTNH
ncbi:MAG TPA: hypothetical protein VN285_12615 [Candidatus Deferrimicrobium sp.]|nr:hypothetical protein [Candidatus Deferrimicrobium sp.]